MSLSAVLAHNIIIIYTCKQLAKPFNDINFPTYSVRNYNVYIHVRQGASKISSGTFDMIYSYTRTHIHYSEYMHIVVLQIDSRLFSLHKGVTFSYILLNEHVLNKI